jgi:hypothetical protein
MRLLYSILLTYFVPNSGQSTPTPNMLSWYYNEQSLIQPEPTSLLIQGKIPSYITGKLLGVGPTNAQFNFTNLYDTFGSLSSWNIDGIANEATYQSFIIPSAKYNETIRASPASTTAPPNDNTNRNLIYQKGSKNLLLLNEFQTMHRVDIQNLQFLGPVLYRDDVLETIGASDALAFSSSEPVEYIDPLGAAVYLINYLIVPVENSTTSVLYLIAMNDQGIRKIFGSTRLPYLPGYLPAVVVIDDYVLITIHPIELDLDLFTASSCLTCSLKSHLSSLPTHLYLFSLLSLSIHHLPEDLDFYPIQHLEIPSTKPGNSPFLVTQFITGWVDLDDTEDYPNDEKMTAVMCVLTDPLKQMDRTSNLFSFGNLEMMRKAPQEENLNLYCDEIRSFEIAIPSRILPRHVYQSPTTPSFGLEPSSSALISTSALRFTDETLREISLHSLVINPLFHDSLFCFIYGLSSETPSAGSGGGDHSPLPGRLVKINLCVEEGTEESYGRSVSSLDELPSPKISTLVSSFSDDRMLFGKPVFVPNSRYEEVPEIEQGGQGQGHWRGLRGSWKAQQQLESPPLPVEREQVPEEEERGSILLPMKSKVDGKNYLNVINAQTMKVEAVIESPSELLYSWKAIFVSLEDM